MGKIFKLTKEKLKGLVILLIGLIIPETIEFLVKIYYGRMGPEKYASFLEFWNTNILFKLIWIIIYLIWLYLIVSIILNINNKKKKR